MKNIKKLNWFLIFLLFWSVELFAFEHKDSHVHFLEYTPKIVQQNLHQKKPYFLLFSAQWCHWCRVFNEKTLTDEKVYSYLNKNFVNIFIDSDINAGAYQKYQAKGVPYTVFLNPDTTVYFKYSGTLYAEPFLEVIQDVRQNIKKGRSVDGEERESFEYIPPTKFKKSTLDSLRKTFQRGVSDNFDLKEYGVGKGVKAILPETFLYLLNTSEGKDRQDTILQISATLKKALETIYDPIEGGFFRYAETSNWQIPHYEKMAGLNAGAALLLYKVDQETPQPKFKKAADQTIGYLSKTLYNADIGSFLSFQEADTSYYFLNKNRRKNVEPPLVINKVFTDRLATTLYYLLAVLNHTSEHSLEKNVVRSLDFLTGMILKNERVFHYYSISKKQWLGESALPNYAFLAKLFQRAATKFKNERYSQAATKILRLSVLKYYDGKKRIFIDSELNAGDFEYLMEMNGGLALGLLGQEPISVESERIFAESLITYFSGMDELLEERFWESKDWQFLERYASFLHAADRFTATQANP